MIKIKKGELINTVSRELFKAKYEPEGWVECEKAIDLVKNEKELKIYNEAIRKRDNGFNDGLFKGE